VIFFNLIEIKRLKIGYLLFKSDGIKNYLDSRKEVKAVCNFGDWTLYRII
jgi:hypothetical protein